jgi:hypothetical protein
MKSKKMKVTDLIPLDTSWLHGKYSDIEPDAEINTLLPYVSIGEYFFQGDDAERAIKEIFEIWNNGNFSTSEAFKKWADNWGIEY